MEYNYGKNYDEEMKQKMLNIAARCQNKIRVVLNHMPLMDRVREDFQPVRICTLKKLKSLYFRTAF